MEFFAVNGKRPVRLSGETRAFAFDSLNHRYGLEAKEHPHVSVDSVVGFEELSDIEKYDVCIERIVCDCPIRICDGEKISGAATLGTAIYHAVPAALRTSAIFSSVSHLTVDFETVLKRGVDGIREDVLLSLERHRGTEREAFLKSCLHCIDCMEIWRQRYLCALRECGGYDDNIANLTQVPFRPAEDFHRAVQSLWFVFAFLRLTGNWPGIGRIDYLLGDYLRRDLDSGRLTLEDAREILAHFFIKGCEWICGGNYGSGDAQHYQNIVLGGVDEDGREVTNEVTYLVLDIIEELGISDFPVTVRLNESSPERLVRRVSEVIRLGGGVVAVYNEGLIIDSLTDYGYSLREARRFANDGCWEVQIPGKTYFSYHPFDSLAILQKETLDSYSGERSYDSFEALYGQFIRDLERQVELIGDVARARFVEAGIWGKGTPCTAVSLFEEGCVEKGLSYLEGGPVYNVVSPHIGGLPDAANSLYAIKKLVFDGGRISFGELMDVLRQNWEGAEPLRQYALNKLDYFGNDNDEADLIASRIVEDFAAICRRLDERDVLLHPAGISTFGRQIEWAPKRLATPYGRRAGEVLAGNFSPTPGTDKAGATAIIRSVCKSDLRRTVSGAALDIKLLPSTVKGENGAEVIASLIRAFVSLGGHFMQVDIADTALLLEAQEHPENYQSLSVRVSGWNARFVTLNKEWQDMIIAQAGSDTL